MTLRGANINSTLTSLIVNAAVHVCVILSSQRRTINLRAVRVHRSISNELVTLDGKNLQ